MNTNLDFVRFQGCYFFRNLLTRPSTNSWNTYDKRSCLGGTISSVTGSALGAPFELRLRNPIGMVLDDTVGGAEGRCIRRVASSADFCWEPHLSAVDSHLTHSKTNVPLLLEKLNACQTQLLYIADAGHARLRVVDPGTTCGSQLSPQALLQECVLYPIVDWIEKKCSLKNS